MGVREWSLLSYRIDGQCKKQSLKGVMEHKYLLKQFSYLIGLLTGRVWPSDIIEIMFFTQYAIPPKGGDTTFISTKLIELSFKKESVDLIEEILTRPPYPEGESFPAGVAGTAAGEEKDTARGGAFNYSAYTGNIHTFHLLLI